VISKRFLSVLLMKSAKICVLYMVLHESNQQHKQTAAGFLSLKALLARQQHLLVSKGIIPSNGSATPKALLL
jgi:hypothetical protein